MHALLSLFLGMGSLALVALAYHGIGQSGLFILRKAAGGWDVKSTQPALEAVVVIVVGAAMCSSVLAITLTTETFNHWYVRFFKVTGIVLFLYFRWHSSSKYYEFRTENIVRALLILLALTIICLFFGLSNTIPHPDTHQYQLAQPWRFAEKGLISDLVGFRQSGIYIAHEMSFLFVQDLRHLGSPQSILNLKIFSSASSAIFLYGVYLLSKEWGLKGVEVFIVIAATFTLGNVIYWGNLKNDIVVAGTSLVSLAILYRAWRLKSTFLLLVAAILCAYSISIKILAAGIFILPVIAVLFSRTFSTKAKAISLLCGGAILLPWLFYALTLQDNPIYPIGREYPLEIRLAEAARNSNGIERNLTNAVKYFLDVVLGNYRINGNYSLGTPFLISVGIGILGLSSRGLHRTWDAKDIIFLSVLIWFCIFYVARFDGRFLSRYILAVCCVSFVYAMFVVQSTLRKYAEGMIVFRHFVVVALASVLVVSAFTSKLNERAYNRSISAFAAGFPSWWAKWQIDVEDWVQFSQFVNETAGNENVAINDHFNLFIDNAIINLHGNHAFKINFYKKDWTYVRDLLRDNSVGVVVFRPDISGKTNAVDEYLRRCTTPVPKNFSTSDPRIVYRVTHICEQ